MFLRCSRKDGGMEINMEINKLASLTETLNKYLSENGAGNCVSPDILTSNKKILDETTDAVIALICKIGVDENFAPNMHGIVLDGCLESLNEIREEYFKNE